jgi:Holliday junction resolvasome RuvABC ATP-dependent DNA helicase subunit
VMLASLLLVEGPERSNEDLRALVLSHWRRGQALLDAEFELSVDDPDQLIRKSVDRLLGTQLRSFDLSTEIIGQDELVEACTDLLNHARRDDDRAGHVVLGAPVLVVGPEGSGRSHIAHALARAVGGDNVLLDARKIRTIAELRLEIQERAPGAVAVVAVIENFERADPVLIRALARTARDGTIRTSKGHDTASISVIAITRGDQLPSGWQRLHIAQYDRDAVAKIIRAHYGWHLEVRRLVALAGRLKPAIALRRARELEGLAGTPRVTERHASNAMEHWGLDRLGLDHVDRNVMAELADGQPASPSHLSSTVGLGPAKLADHVLPYLAQLGLVNEPKPGYWKATRTGLDVYGAQND